MNWTLVTSLVLLILTGTIGVVYVQHTGQRPRLMALWRAIQTWWEKRRRRCVVPTWGGDRAASPGLLSTPRSLFSY